MVNRIDTRLRAVIAEGRPIVGLFATVGYPDVDTSVEVASAILRSDGDFLELGVPFSDPLAEGPTIQKTSFSALQQGVTLDVCLDSARRIREDDDDAPLIFMGYYNPYLKYGLDRFVDDAKQSGVDGLIVPDLPAEESGPLVDLCKKKNVHVIPMLATTSTDERIASACAAADGFIYCVSVTGVTGARKTVQAGVQGLVARIRTHTVLPVLVGFGVSTKQHVEEIARFADGVLIGSALMNAVGEVAHEKAADAAVKFVIGLRPSP